MAYKSFLSRAVRRLRAMSMVWQRRIIFGVGGLMVGVTGAGLAVVADGSQDLFHDLISHFPHIGLLVSPSVSVWSSG